MTRFLRFLSAMLTISGLTAITGPVHADHGGCVDCGCVCGVKKVCRKVCEVEKIKVPCWASECEDFCLPNPPDHLCPNQFECCCNGGHACSACGGCSTCGTCGCQQGPLAGLLSGLRCFHRESSTACVYTRKKLLLREIEKEVPVTKWEVVTLCAGCCGNYECCDPGEQGEVRRPASSAPSDAAQPQESTDTIPPAPILEPSARRARTPGRAATVKSRSPYTILQTALQVWSD